MAQARRRPSGRRTRRPGWLLLLIGIGIGVASVVLWQMYARHSDGRSGLSNLLHSFNQPADKPAAKKEPEPAKPVKPKFDFYTILPETETVLPERRSARNKPPAKTKPDDGASYILQAGSFASYEEADQLKAKLALSGMVAQIQKVIIEGKGEYHRVRLGPYEKAEQLDAPAQQLQKMGIKVIRLKIKKGGAGPSPL